MKKNSLFVPVLAILGSAFTLAIGTSMAKTWLFPTIGAYGTTTLRLGFSALIVILFWRPWQYSFKKKDLIILSRYGLALGLMNLFFYMALETIPFGIAVAIEFTGPLAVAFYSSRRVIDYVWIGFAVIGLSLLLPFTGESIQNLDLKGVIFAVIAAACWGTYIIFAKRASHIHAGQSVAIGLLIAAIVAMPMGVIHAGSDLLQPKLIFLGLLVATFSSAIPISLEMYALKYLPRQTFGTMTSLEPVVAALAGILFLGEFLSLFQWLAILCIMTASIGSVLSVRTKI